MTSTGVNNLITKLQEFGLEKEESRIYEYLLKNGQTSVTQISKDTSIPRGSVYRFIENLLLTQLIIEVTTPRGRKFEAGSVHNLETILKQRTNELLNLKNSFNEVEKIIKNISIPNIAKTKIISYEGMKGLEQITWNSSKAKDELRIIELSTMSRFLDFGFAEKTRTEFILNKVHVKELTNQTKLKDWTEITQFVTDFWECRHIPKLSFEISFEILIYNDVYTMYNYKDNDIMGVEIHNKQLAKMQKQIFDYLWGNATALNTLNKNGKSTIK